MTSSTAQATEPAVPRMARDICECIEPIDPQTRCERVAECFGSNPELFALPVVDDKGTPLGLLNRFRLLERLSQRFGRDLLLRRAIVDCLEAPPLLLALDTPIEDVGARLFADGRTHIQDGFIVVDDTGRYVGVGTGVGLTRALSELTVARMRAVAEEAARRDAAKSAFVANVSHEIRTPLNAVIGLTNLLLDTALGEDQQEYVEVLRASGEALLALIDDVLDYSTIEAEKFRLNVAPFELRGVVADAVKILAIRSRGKDLTIHGEVDASVPASLIGDAARLRQVLLNLGGNAVKFTERGSVRIRVRAERGGDGRVAVHIRIEDTGIGIAPEKFARLFRPYSQADATIARRYGGTGLGLAICREIVERMNGAIAVESAPGQGTTFSLRVLLDADAASAEASPARRAQPRLAQALTVLVAEDNKVNQLVVAGILRKLGCAVHVVADGQEALDALQRQPFDVVLMDCHMPRMDGIEATRRIRCGSAGVTACGIPIIALTASATTDAREECLAAGMDAYLTKPITPPALQQELARWLPRAS